MSSFVNTVDVIGDDALTDSIITRTITEYRDDRITIVGVRAFYYCTALTLVDLPSVTFFDNAAFAYCNALIAVILRNEHTICRMTYNTVLPDATFKNGNGYAYVPRSLLSDTNADKDYRRSTQWVNYVDRIRALEDYTVDGTIWGELDWDKINAA